MQKNICSCAWSITWTRAMDTIANSAPLHNDERGKGIALPEATRQNP